jgi:uncharacterized membrane protein
MTLGSFFSRKEALMQPMPLHPAIVHVPIGVALVLPPIALGVAWAMRRAVLPRAAWLIVVFLLAGVFGGGILAMRTGEAEEERVEAVVAKSLLEQHEEMAEVFVWASGLLLLLAAVVWFLPGRAQRWAPMAVAVLTLAVTVLALRAGKAGGELMYLQGGARAFVSAPEAPHLDD